MEPKVNYTIVGGFVIILIATFVLGIIWLSSGFSLVQYSTYLVYMKEAVTGLNVDSPVEYNGVGVGSIKSIEINPKNPQSVELLLNIKSDTPITKGTVATLDSKGLTGLTYVQLKDQGTNLTPLVAINHQPYPVIPTSPSIFVRLDTALTEINRSFHEISNSLHGLLDKENLQVFKQTLQNLQEFTGNLASNSQQLNAIISNTSRASQQFQPLMQTSVNAMKVLESQTLPTFYQLVNNLNKMTNNMTTVTSEIKSNPAILIRGKAQSTLGPGEQK